MTKSAHGGIGQGRRSHSTPAEHLAILLRAAYVKAYASYGVGGVRPDWDNLAALDAEFYVRQAQMLLDAGVRLPRKPGVRQEEGNGVRIVPSAPPDESQAIGETHREHEESAVQSTSAAASPTTRSRKPARTAKAESVTTKGLFDV